LVGLVLLEAGFVAAAPPLRGAPALWATGCLRAAETLLCWIYWRGRGWGLGDLGLRGQAVARGLAVGMAVAGAFGALVIAGEAAGRLLGRGSFLQDLAGPRPEAKELLALLVVGVGVAPLFEEAVFRGLLYGSVRRRLGVPLATVASVLIFAAAHLVRGGVPWPQTVGGILFCLSYEWSGSLWAPVLVHAAGNLALFLLPFALR
jgi:membrane protease YdiL (CAAX protease family)